MTSKPVQYFSAERLATDATLSKDEIARFLDEFQSLVHGNEGPRKLISLRIPKHILDCCKLKAKIQGRPYQGQIVEMIRNWVRTPEPATGQMKWRPEKIISGGQTGVDRAALDVGNMLHIKCGGWCPRGRKAEDGMIDWAYPLIETPSEQYRQRTEWNVRDGDATLVLTWGTPSGGTLLALRLAKSMKKPSLVVDLSKNPDLECESTRKALDEFGTRILNIAGPRARAARGTNGKDKIYSEAYKFLTRLFLGD